MFGVGTDQILEFEKEDLYRALSGGDVKVHGVATCETFRTYPDAPVAGLILYIDASQTTEEEYWTAVKRISAYNGVSPAWRSGVALLGLLKDWNHAGRL
ncbi:Uu.00g132350.m01.CDS01 [Anthostomella pinea]|uniref:Uu.00g132350.m01.CDS01 n=1 Tax=Anthostomella pinea TaxID=933095 RepID=A0AAI8VJN4_9PEZI|nr:Uu.00g132350.m01.CDS01 [Anthostomella pinea]